MSLREELLKVRQEKGYLTPEAVVEAARPKDHPLHRKVFDRPIEEAAEAYYKDRAHELIRLAFRPVTKDEKDTGLSDKRIRAFRPVPANTPSGYDYMPVEEIAKDPIKVQIVRQDLEREWQTLLARAREFDGFIEQMSKDIQEVIGNGEAKPTGATPPVHASRIGLAG